MNISELREGMKDINIEAEVIEVKKPREVKGNKKVIDISIRDKSGSAQVAIWGDSTDIKAGEIVELEDAYCGKFYKGEPQLSIRYGSIKALGPANEPSPEGQETLTPTDKERYLKGAFEQIRLTLNNLERKMLEK